jgi:hypothetical protein
MTLRNIAIGAVIIIALSWFFTVVYPIVCFLKPGCEL